MKLNDKAIHNFSAAVIIATGLSACGGDSGGGGTATGAANSTPELTTPIDVTQAALVTSANKVTGGNATRSGKDFSFPDVNNQNGSLNMTIPADPAPLFPARRTVISGGGQKIGFGQPVILKYDMFSWSDGALVESSDQFVEAHTVTAGVTEDFPIPEYLASSLLGRSLGDVIQVVLPKGTEDLPHYLDANDAHVLLVQLF